MATYSKGWERIKKNKIEQSYKVDRRFDKLIERLNQKCKDEWKKREYQGGFVLTGNDMSLKYEGKDYKTSPESINYILTRTHTADGGNGIFRRHFANHYHTAEQGKMIKEKLIGDLVLNFKEKDTKNNVYLVLPIFKTQNSNQNGAEILKLAKGIKNGHTKQSNKDLEMLAQSQKTQDGFRFSDLQLSSSKNKSTNGVRDFETVNLTKTNVFTMFKHM